MLWRWRCELLIERNHKASGSVRSVKGRKMETGEEGLSQSTSNTTAEGPANYRRNRQRFLHNCANRRRSLQSAPLGGHRLPNVSSAKPIGRCAALWVLWRSIVTATSPPSTGRSQRHSGSAKWGRWVAVAPVMLCAVCRGLGDFFSRGRRTWVFITKHQLYSRHIWYSK